MPKLTADNITDEQIRELRYDKFISLDDRHTCARALNEFGMNPTDVVDRARARCAEILNARAEDKK